MNARAEEKSTPPVHERYQEKLFLGSSHIWAIKHLKQLSQNSTVLDIGPGSGIMAQALRDQGVKNLFAVDIDAETRERLKPLYQKISDTPETFHGQQFDCILLLDVLEHMTDPEPYLQKVSRLLTPGGFFLISLPNIAHWSVRFPLFFGFFEYHNRAILDHTHYQHFTRRRVRKMVKKVPGLCLQEFTNSVEPVEFVLPEWMTKNAFFQIGKRIYINFSHIFPGLLGYQHLVKITKKEFFQDSTENKK